MNYLKYTMHVFFMISQNTKQMCFNLAKIDHFTLKKKIPYKSKLEVLCNCYLLLSFNVLKTSKMFVMHFQTIVFYICMKMTAIIFIKVTFKHTYKYSNNNRKYHCNSKCFNSRSSLVKWRLIKYGQLQVYYIMFTFLKNS